jgi:hypothetical protein
VELVIQEYGRILTEKDLGSESSCREKPPANQDHLKVCEGDIMWFICNNTVTTWLIYYIFSFLIMLEFRDISQRGQCTLSPFWILCAFPKEQSHTFIYIHIQSNETHGLSYSWQKSLNLLNIRFINFDWLFVESNSLNMWCFKKF